MYFLSGSDVFVNVPGGFEKGFSFYYSSASAASVQVYSEVNGGGTLLASLDLNAQHNQDCVGDPNGVFCNWSPIGVTFQGLAKSIDFGGAANGVGFDQITFGSSSKCLRSHTSMLVLLLLVAHQYVRNNELRCRSVE